MSWTKEEELWIILSHILESNDVIYSNERIANLLIRSGITNIEHIKKEFFKIVLPSFIFHATIGYNIELNPEQVVETCHFREKNLFFRMIGFPIQQLITCFVSKEHWYNTFNDISNIMLKNVAPQIREHG